MPNKPFNQTTAFAQLQSHQVEIQGQTLTNLFQTNPQRSNELSVKTEHFFYDYSRQLVTPKTMELLFSLARETGLKEKIAAMFHGEKINKTEDRAVLHIALRNPSNNPILFDGKDVMPAVNEVLLKIEKFSTQILSGERKGFTSKKFKNIVSIGIGGSYLGPEYLAVALAPYAIEGMRLIFIANIDGTDFAQKTSGLDPAETLFIIVSKTFTTAETMQNARTAKQWLMDKLGTAPAIIKKHFIAVSTAQDKVMAFGIDPENMFGFWDWVGGRFSASSAVGAVPLSLYLGFDNFKQVLAGAHWLDRHFLDTPLEKNLPILCGLLDIWNINFLGLTTRALLPYSQGLAKLPAHTQQVEMESNGKQVDMEGRSLTFQTGEVVFGEPGTNGQHSFYQLLHQGTQAIPCDFIGFICPQYPIGENSAGTVSHHLELMTNFLAQPDALAFGKKDTLPQKNFPGNRPSSSLLLQKLSPFIAGLLLALTEHRTAVKGFVWGINSFDQFGVELGKVLGIDQRQRMLKFYSENLLDKNNLNTSTGILLEVILTGRLPLEV